MFVRARSSFRSSCEVMPARPLTFLRACVIFSLPPFQDSPVSMISYARSFSPVKRCLHAPAPSLSASAVFCPLTPPPPPPPFQIHLPLCLSVPFLSSCEVMPALSPSLSASALGFSAAMSVVAVRSCRCSSAASLALLAALPAQSALRGHRTAPASTRQSGAFASTIRDFSPPLKYPPHSPGSSATRLPQHFRNQLRTL